MLHFFVEFLSGKIIGIEGKKWKNKISNGSSSTIKKQKVRMLEIK